MVSSEVNDLLTQTDKGTPMGELFRRFWLPALLPSELPEGDCPPVRLRMMNEDLVAWRNTDGSVGIMQNACPHRGASMFFGRNEENGLRCVYHGWKFDTEGACVDMPNEPAESNFKHKIKATAYRAADWGGVIWIYMGPSHLAPELPQFEWCFLPPEQKVISKWYQDCNYAQGMEGDLDTSHVSFLHRQFDGQNAGLGRVGKGGMPFMITDGSPALTVRETDYGFCYGARRTADDGAYYWRVTQFLLPGYSLIPSPTSQLSSGSWLPIDDTHCMGWRFGFDIENPISPERRAGVGGVPRMIPGTFQPLATRDNDYLIDREMQRTFNYTGNPVIREQDTMMTETMGAVMDRTREHLGTADGAVILYRRQLIKMARALQQGIEPFQPSHGEVFRVRALDTVDMDGNLATMMGRHEAEVLRLGAS